MSQYINLLNISKNHKSETPNTASFAPIGYVVLRDMHPIPPFAGCWGRTPPECVQCNAGVVGAERWAHLQHIGEFDQS